MDEAAKHHLNQFVQVCINPTLCPEDWRRLYRDYLVQHGCSLQKASWVSAQYQHLYDQQPASPTTPHVK